MENYGEILKNIKEEGIFVRFPELKPFEGANYYNEKIHSKLLLIGESNYFEDKFVSISGIKQTYKKIN